MKRDPNHWRSNTWKVSVSSLSCGREKSYTMIYLKSSTMFRTCEIYLFLTCTWMLHVHSQRTHCSRNSASMLCDPNVDPSSLYSQYREYKLPRIYPAVIGRKDLVRLDATKTRTMITRGIKPPIYEIPEFLSPTECSYLIQKSKAAGLTDATMFGGKGSYIKTKGTIHTRKGALTFVETGTDKVLRNLRHRVATLTKMPVDLVADSENLQVARYGVGGHYHSHYDSTKTNRLPCCHQTPIPHTMEKCRVCRYITVMVYLNDVKMGGETAFPLADTKNVTATEIDYNLSKYCRRASLVIKPKIGKAVMWYNNFLDKKTGWLGDRDPNSLHGGCAVLQGEKWIANFWISAPTYEHRYEESIFRN